MAKKKKEDVHCSQLNTDELSKRLEKTENDLFTIRFRAATAPLKNSMQIQTLRREVARLKTFINQKGQKG